MVVLVLEVHDTEDLGGLGVLDHHHVAFCVVGLDGHTEIVAWLVFISHLQSRLHGGLLLPSPVTTQLQRVVGVKTPGSQVTGSTHAPEDGPDVGHTLLVSECDRHPYCVVYCVCLRLRWVGWQADPPASLIGSSQATTQELNPWGSLVNLRLPSSQIVLADPLQASLHPTFYIVWIKGQPKVEDFSVVT